MPNFTESGNYITCSLDEQNAVLIVEVKSALAKEDFILLSKVIDPFYQRNGELKGIIINTKKFPFWKSSESFSAHISFVKNYHYKTKKIALAIDSFLPKLLAKLARRFIHAEVKNFSYNKIDEARDWILS
jgi:hypothetical protein